MTTKKNPPEDNDRDLKTAERTASDTRPSDREADRARDGAELTPETDPKQNEDLGIPGGYTEAQKEIMRASREEDPNLPTTTDEEELEKIKHNTEAAVEGRSVDIGSAPKEEGSVGGGLEAPHSIPPAEMQQQISNEMDAERRTEQQKQQQEHDEAAKQVREALNAEQKKQADEAKAQQPGRQPDPNKPPPEPNLPPMEPDDLDDAEEDDENGKKSGSKKKKGR